MVGREIRVTLNLGNRAVLEMNQYPTTAVAGTTISPDDLLSGRFTHINHIALYHLKYELLNVWHGPSFCIPTCYSQMTQISGSCLSQLDEQPIG